MKLLTLKIDNSKYHFVDFEGNNDPQQQYIFNSERADRSIIGFFPFNNNNIKEGVTLQTNEARSRCYISKIVLTENTPIDNFAGELPCVSISLSAERPKDANVINDVRLKLTNDGQLSLATNPTNSAIISVKVTYEGVLHQFTLIYASIEKVSDAVLDFGSEASQLLIGSRDRDITLNNILNLFREVKGVNIAGTGLFKSTEDSDFAQYSENNEKLFLSKFMMRKSIDVELLNDENKEINSGEFLKFIFKNSDIDVLKQDYLVLPNTKIMNFGVDDIEINVIEQPGEDGVCTCLQELGDDLCHRMSVNVFLFQALEQVRQNNIGRGRNRSVEFISFSILMPNNYSYKDIAKRLKYIRVDIQQIIDVFSEKFNFIKGFEVSAVSESDASLIGASEISPQNIGDRYRFNNGNYLILDAGKGTFDFSIMKYTREDSVCFQNLCKSGIIGAGNAISYAILLDIIDGIIVKDSNKDTHLQKIQTFIEDIVLGNSATGKANGGGDPSNLLKLMNAIEVYKRAARADGHKIGTRIDAKGLYIDGVINTINNEFINQGQCLIEHRFTDIMIEKIVDSIFSQIEKVNTGNDIDYYVCAGRGFMYRPLKEAITRKIEGKIPKCKGEITYIGNNNNATPKNVCLFISNVIKNGKYNSNIIGIPFILNDPIREENDKNDAKTQDSEKNFFGQLCQQFKQLCSKDNVVNIESILMPTNQSYNYNSGNVEDNPMVNGYHFNNRGGNVSRINIGGIEFGLSRTIPKNANIDVFYNGEEYIIRSNRGVYEIDSRVNVEGQFVFESLFPSVKGYPNSYTPFFAARDFNEEEHVAIEPITSPGPQNQEPDQSANEGIIKPIAVYPPQSPEPDCDTDDSDDSKDTPSEVDILLYEIAEQENKLKQ